MMIQTAVILSVFFGFLSFELLGVLSGGLVSSGYLAFYFDQPYRLASTLVLAVVTCLIVKLLQHRIILFGRRRFMLTVLLGIFLAEVIERNFFFFLDVNRDLRIIGYIIPGLIANDMEKQGILKTLLMVMTSAGIIWLLIHLVIK